MDKVHWLLPEGIDEAVPPYAGALEKLRRQLLDIYDSWGYDLVMPPFIEFLDSLLMGAGADVDLKTFKLIDQVSGRLMGVRADMTTQIARIDAHHLENDSPARLCYTGTVLHTRPDGFGGTRAPLQIGAELYGHSGFQSDVEIISLMLETLECAKLKDVSVDLGHVGIFRGLSNEASLDAHQEANLFEALQRKAMPEIAQLLSDYHVSADLAHRIQVLADLNGSSDVMAIARDQLKGSSEQVMDALDYVEAVAGKIEKQYPDLPIHYDLSELRGYNFHTGVVFSAFVPQSGVEVARGGRYDNIGGEFGRARPATGFSTDLRNLLKYSTADFTDNKAAILAPGDVDENLEDELREAMTKLRTEGRRVVRQLPGQSGNPSEQCCQDHLVYENGQWQVSKIEN